MVIKFKILKMQSLLQVGIFLMCFKNILMQSSIIPYSNLLDGLLAGVSMICIAISILSEKQSLKEIIFFVMLIFASLICAIKTNNNIFIIMSMICWVIKNDNFDAIILNIFKIQLFLFVIHTILSLTFLILGKQEIVMTISGIERYCFGFRHPNSFSIYMFNLLLLWTWINYKKLRFKHLCVIGAISVISWRFTKTRTSLLIALVFCLLLFVAKSKYKLKNVLNSIAKFALPICAMFTFLCVKLYIVGNKIGLFINDLLSNRIKLGAYTIEHFGFSFGDKIYQDIMLFGIQNGE